MNVLLVFLGAAVGAPVRYLADLAVQSRHRTPFPWGTLAVNVVGSLALGALIGLGAAVPGPWRVLLEVGFCGAVTTYSTFGLDTLRLAEERAYLVATANVVGSVLAGLVAALVGYTAVHTAVG